MARQSSVSGAYTKVGNPSVKLGSSGNGRCMAVAGVIVFFLFFMSLGGDSTNNESDNMGQAHHSSTSSNTVVEYRPGVPGSETVAPGNTYGVPDSYGEKEGSYSNSGGSGEVSLHDAVDMASQEIRDAENKQLEESQTMISSALSSVGNSLRIGMGKLLGNNASDEELEEIANKVQDRLTQNVTAELQQNADDFAHEEVEKIDNAVDIEEMEGEDYEFIEGDVMIRKQDAILHVREEISDAAVDMKTSLRGKAAEIEKEILEERLSKRLGKKVKLVVVDDQIQGIDDLFNGLPIIGASQPYGNGGYAGAGNGGFQNNNGGGGGGNGGYRINGGYRTQQQQQQPQQQQQRPAVAAPVQTFHGYGLPVTPAGYGYDVTGAGMKKGGN